MTKAYLENKNTGKQFEVVRFDRAAGTVVLRGEYGEFTEEFDPKLFRQLGYELKKE